jgi:hypothetical protein
MRVAQREKQDFAEGHIGPPGSQPEVPVTLGDVFLRASECSWYIRWNGEGAYVGSSDGRKAGALLGLELLKGLLSSPGWEASPTQLLGFTFGSVAGNGSGEISTHPNLIATTGIGYGNNHINLGFGVTTLGDDVTSRQVLRYINSAKAPIARQLPAFADYLKATVLPPSRGAAVWSYEDRCWTTSDYPTRWTFGNIDDFVPSKHDSSNVFRRESSTEWFIRFGNHECRASHSEGMEMLSVLLLHPAVPMSADQICGEIGIGTASLAAASCAIERRSVELAQLRKRAEEFRREMELTSERPYDDEPYQFPESVPELIEELKPVPKRLTVAAKNSRAETTLRSRGIQHFSGEQIKGTFEELVAKMARCEDLIVALREWEEGLRNAMRESTADRANPALKRRVSKAIRDAISQINSGSVHIGAYFKLNFRSDNSLFFMNITTHWRVGQSPEIEFCTES